MGQFLLIFTFFVIVNAMVTFIVNGRKMIEFKKHIRDNSSGFSDCLGMTGEVRWCEEIHIDFVQSQWLRTWSILELFLREILVSAFQKSIVCGGRWDTTNEKLNENISSSAKRYV